MGSATGADGSAGMQVGDTGAVPVPMMNPAAVAAAEASFQGSGGFVSTPPSGSPPAPGALPSVRVASPKKYE